jgi:hypothetical protein
MDLTKIKRDSERQQRHAASHLPECETCGADARAMADKVPDLLAEIERLEKGDAEIAEAVREEIDRLATAGSFVINVSIGGMDATAPDFLASVRSAVEQGVRQAVSDAKEGTS